ncbi:hypothetical protein Tco_1312208 [Tanacetum coccineum]
MILLYDTKIWKEALYCKAPGVETSVFLLTVLKVAEGARWGPMLRCSWWLEENVVPIAVVKHGGGKKV